MANMSYCRFHNTYGDLYDCKDALENFLNGDYEEIANADEIRCARKLIEMCGEIASYADDFEDVVRRLEEEEESELEEESDDEEED